MDQLYKYPRTPHLPWSRSKTEDDKVLDNVDHFVGKKVVCSSKLDGESTSLYPDHIHARSVDSKHHPSRSWVKNLWQTIRHDIPRGWRICGENMYAKHSIAYSALPSYFLVYAIFNEANVCLSWEGLKMWCELLDLTHVPVLHEGIWDEEAVKACMTGVSKYGGEQEGYVVRLASAFYYSEFRSSVAKFVRANHVQTDDFWMNKPVVKNLLAEKKNEKENH